MSAVVVALGLAACWAGGPSCLLTVVRQPAEAKIPGSEHMGYVENWFAVYGLGRWWTSSALEPERPVTVIVPPASRESRVMVPYGGPALVPAARSERPVRRSAVALAGPGSPRASPDRSRWPDIPGGQRQLHRRPRHRQRRPAYTRQLERRLAQDVPEAREVLRIPRPMAPNWLSLYRLDE